MAEGILQIENLVKHFPIGKPLFGLWGRKQAKVRAVDGISFSIGEGETFGLVGESGSGKSTTARLITRLIRASDGKIYFKGEEILELSESDFSRLRRHIQMVFQEPYTSLNPRMRVAKILGNPLRLHRLVPRSQIQERVVELLEMVGLEANHRHCYPHEFSGGQRQRISIARAMALEPDLVIADEPVSALDVSVRAQILNLFLRLRETRNLTYLFIAHDLSVVEHFCDRVAVMYAGNIVEVASVDGLFNSPLHPYTEALISAIPEPESHFNYRPQTLKGDRLNVIDQPRGCVFQNRCPLAQPACAEAHPPLEERDQGHWVACYFR
jgi:oligopeptide/dipeptide ABC transporter ATP-binding protein